MKKGYFPFDRSRTVEEALSSNIDKLKWSKYTSKKNRTIVKADGVWKGKPVFYRTGILTYAIVRPGNKVEVFFVVNRDGSFSFYSGKVTSNSKNLGFLEDENTGETDVVKSRELKTMGVKNGFLGVMYR